MSYNIVSSTPYQLFTDLSTDDVYNPKVAIPILITFVAATTVLTRHIRRPLPTPTCPQPPIWDPDSDIIFDEWLIQAVQWLNENSTMFPTLHASTI